MSRAGVVPISHTQDTTGPHGRTVADTVIALNAVASRTVDPRDPATGGVPLGWQACNPVCNGTPLAGKNRPALPANYSAFLNSNGLSGARLGLTRQGIDGAPPQVVAAFDATVAAIKDAGATIVDLDDPANNFSFSSPDGEFLVLEYDLKVDLTKYFHTRVGVPVAGGNLQSAIDFNNAHAAAEMPYFGQEIFIQAQSLNLDPNFCQPGFTSTVLPSTTTCMSYNDALKIDHMAGASLDAALANFNLDAILAPTDSPGVDDRSDPRRSLPVRELGPRGAGRVPDHPGAVGRSARDAGGHQLHRNGVQRADADQAGLGVRSGDARAVPANVRARHHEDPHLRNDPGASAC